MSAIFGKPAQQQQTSHSDNQAYPYLQGAYSGQVHNGTDSADMLHAMLTGGAGSDAAFTNYKNSAGFNSTLDAGSHAITNNNAAKGFLQSGATGKALEQFGQQTNQSYYNNFLDKLLGSSQQGLGAGGIISGAGQQSVSQGTSTGPKEGIGKFLGTIAAGAASDPRLKMDVTKVGEASNGLNIYDFRYIWDDEDAPLTRGYMADEVAEIAPHALGELIDNEFMTVRYGLLPSIQLELI